MKTPVLLSLMSGLLLAAHPAAADTVAVPKAGLDTCLQTIDRLNRLDCFDKLLGTPMSVLSGGTSSVGSPAPSSQEKPPIAVLAHAMEQARKAGDDGWQFRYSRVGSDDLLTLPELMAEAAAAPTAPPPPLAEEDALPEKSAAIYAAQNPGDLLQPGTANVYLTMPETPPSDATDPADRAILMLSCEANITTARIILPQSLSLGPHTIEIRTASGRPETETWQAVADGTVLMNARGLTSIADITQWRAAPRIQMSLGIGNENRALLFEMENLAEMLPPLRRACQW
ncbi:type VI secretion system-associated protein TagO [Martelella mangrovi]|uniref:Type VI secretion system protein VasI n=1 Tax=Martelella mangrovi TaxID=1397477 RepID=A0ABV2IC00_9HYPH